MPVGIKVTLRGNQMWEFLLRLIAISLPNIRDFRGVPSKLDGQGNYTLGITDHSIFPEINVERQRVNIGMDISIVTSAGSDEEATESLDSSVFLFANIPPQLNKSRNLNTSIKWLKNLLSTEISKESVLLPATHPKERA